MSKYLIYALHSEHSDYLYVGKSCSGLSRPKSHFSPSSLKIQRPVAFWINKRLAAGQEVEIAVLEEHQSATILAESLGAPLLNLTDGGDGVSNPPLAVREKRALALQKFIAELSEEERQVRFANLRWKRTPEYCIAVGLQRLGKKHSTETIEKLTAARNTDEYRTRASLWHRNKPHSAEAKEKISVGMKTWYAEHGTGTRSPEWRARISAGRRRWAMTQRRVPRMRINLLDQNGDGSWPT